MASPACGWSDFARPQNSTRADKGGGPRQRAAGCSRLDGAGFERLRDQAAAAALQRLRQRPAAGDGVQADGGGQRGGGGALLHGGAHVGRGLQRVARSGGEVAHTLDPLAELPGGRDWKRWGQNRVGLGLMWRRGSDRHKLRSKGAVRKRESYIHAMNKNEPDLFID